MKNQWNIGIYRQGQFKQVKSGFASRAQAIGHIERNKHKFKGVPFEFAGALVVGVSNAI